MKRYTVRYCYEGESLFRPDGTPVHHTWDVVDRTTGKVVANRDTRSQARSTATEYEQDTRCENTQQALPSEAS